MTRPCRRWSRPPCSTSSGSRARNITIRIIPDSVGLTSALYFPFMILTPSGDRAKTVYVETLTDGLLVDEESRISHYEAVFRELLAVSVTDMLDSVEA